MIVLKRIYDKPSELDGFRVLVDRLWPRGISKTDSRLDLWLKDIGPSNDLRRWFRHDPKKYIQFAHKYESELDHDSEIQYLKKIVDTNSVVTFLYGARDTQRNNAVVLKDYLESKFKINHPVFR